MSPETIAEQLIHSLARSDYSGIPSHLSERLSLAVVRALISHVAAEYLRDARQGLRIANLMSEAADCLNSEEARALACWMKATVLNQLGQYGKAIANYQQAEQFFVAQKKWNEAVGLQINQVATLRNMGEYERAIALAGEARAILTSLDQPSKGYWANLEVNVAWAFKQIGELSASLTAYEKAQDAYTALDDAVSVAATKIDTGIIYEELGQFDKAAQLYREARTAFLAEGQQQEVARADLNIGILAYRRGHYHQALHQLETAHADFAALDNQAEVAIVDLYRSYVYLALNLTPEAFHLARKAEIILKKNKQRWPQALAVMNQARAQVRLGRWQQAAKSFDRSRRLLRRMKAIPSLQRLDLERAQLALTSGRPRSAQRIAGRVGKEIDRRQDPMTAVHIHLILAQCNLNDSPPRLAQAQENAQSALNLAQTYEFREFSIQAHYLLGVIAERKSEYPAARRAIQKAIQTSEYLRQHLLVDDLVINYLEDKLQIYQAGVRLDHQAAAEIAAFDQLVHSLNLAFNAPLPVFHSEPVKTPDKDLANKNLANKDLAIALDRLRQEWHWQRQQLEIPDVYAAPEDTDAVSLRQKTRLRLQHIETDIADLIRRQRMRGTRRAADLKSQAAAQESGAQEAGAQEAGALLPELQRALGSDEALVLFYLAGGNGHALIVTNDGASLAPDLAKTEAIAQLLRAWRFHIRHHVNANVAADKVVKTANHYLRQIHEGLVAPIRKRLEQKSRWLVVLPPEWHELPLAASYDGATYLVDSVQLAYLSAPEALLNANRGQLPDGRHGANLFVAAHSDDGRLTHTKREADSVIRSAPASWDCQWVVEDEATVTAVQGRLATSDIIHVAAHATFRPDNPLFSWIQLADGRLTVADLYETQLLRRPLVVLSACETGRGVPRGGGLSGMGRMLLAAGASGLIVSQWPIDDDASANLMQTFYRSLLPSFTEGLPRQTIAQTLQIAQQQTMKQHQHPVFWAGLHYVIG
ncbi:MAG: CHAT domain-containing protein [Chloroflexi bacterium]|nr:CHAT domain-containing protein [Chloroflexota bacterium]